MKFSFLIAGIAALMITALITQSDKLMAQPAGFGSCSQSKTVWLDASPMSRRKGAAKNMNEIHDDMARRGWSFTDMEIYTENSDLEGFFLTYNRAIACG